MNDTPYPRSEMVDMLRQQVCQVKFIKVNGEERNMQATLREDLIPDHKKPKDKGMDDGVQITIDVIKCFDVDKEDWRSFRVENVLNFSYP